jgi:hypothetical protein
VRSTVTLYYILDETGEPQPVHDVLVWAEWIEGQPDRVVLQTRVHRGRADEAPLSRRRGGTWISTVFLGIDHNFAFHDDDDAAPVLWETLIFGGPFDGEMARYASKIDALEGHVAYIARVQALGARLPRGLKRALAKRRAEQAPPFRVVRLRPGDRRRLARFDARFGVV